MPFVHACVLLPCDCEGGWGQQVYGVAGVSVRACIGVRVRVRDVRACTSGACVRVVRTYVWCVRGFACVLTRAWVHVYLYVLRARALCSCRVFIFALYILIACCNPELPVRSSSDTASPQDRNGTSMWLAHRSLLWCCCGDRACVRAYYWWACGWVPLCACSRACTRVGVRARVCG